MVMKWMLFVGLIAIVLALVGWRNGTKPKGPTPAVIRFDGEAHPDWRPLNDGVMGGLSEGAIEWTESGLHWRGRTRLENNGGFSSIRSPWSSSDLRGLDQIVIRCRGNGGPFKWTMERSERWWMPYVFGTFSPEENWSDVVIRKGDLGWSQAFAGDMPDLTVEQSLANILRFGVMKYDGTASAFDLEIASIRFEFHPE